MQIIVTRVSGRSAGRQLTVDVEGDWTVDKLKAEIEKDHGIPAGTQLITFNAVKLLTGTKLRDYKIHLEAALQLAERPAGGGRHAPEQGSLDQEIALICGAGDGLRARWRLLGESKARLEERKQALMLTNSGGELKKKIKLNVGGQLCEVRRKVLCDAVPESHLAELFSGRWENKLLSDSDGLPFLDCNPECFGAVIGFLKARLKNRHHVEVPVVAEELVPTLHRMLDHFGLGHLFAETGAEDAEPEPENEAGPQEEGVPPVNAADDVDAAAPPDVVQEREHRAAENELVELPARSIDHIISARYGSLDEPRKWIDVTRALVALVDEEGGLKLTVSSRGFGADPAPDTQKHLSIRYKPCEAWESESPEDRLKRLQAVADTERAALRRAVKKQRERELDFEDELEWVKHYTKAELRPAAPEVVELAVGIGVRTRVCVKRSSLLLCEGSVLARKFDPQAAPAPADTAAAPADGDDSDDSDDSDGDDGGVAVIEEDSQCFRKLIDQLRLIAIAQPGDPPPPPFVRGHEEAVFAKLLGDYFGGAEDFITTKGEHRLAGGANIPNAYAAGQKFPYDGRADQGVLNHIATDGNTVAWSNPHQSGKVKVTAGGGLESHSASFDRFVGQVIEGAGPGHGTAWGSSAPGFWFAVDLQDHGRVCVDYYCLRHNKCNVDRALRNWELQGSNSSAGPWSSLRKHENDATLTGKPGQVAGWAVETREFFSVFRILSTGPNQQGNHYLCCSGIELFGQLVKP